MVHIYNGILLSHKKSNEILPFVTMWMDLEGIAPNEVSQLEKDKNHSISLMCKIQKQNKQNRKRLIDTENRLMVVRGEGVWRV